MLSRHLHSALAACPHAPVVHIIMMQQYRSAIAVLTALLVATATATLKCNDPTQPAYVFQSSYQYSYFKANTLKVFAAYVPPPPLKPVLSPYVGAWLGFDLLSVFEATAGGPTNFGNCTNIYTIDESRIYNVQDFNITDAYCEGRAYNQTLSSGVVLNTYNVTVTHPAFPGTTLNLVASQASHTYTETVDASPLTSNLVINMTHLDWAPKLELYINNWPWQQPLGETFIAFWNSFDVYSPNDTFMEISGPITSPWITLSVDVGAVQLKADLLNAYELDGIFWAQPSGWSTNITVPANQTTSFMSAGVICTPEGNTMPTQWERAFIDPTLLALWNGPDYTPSSSEYGTTPSGSLGTGGIAAIAVVLGVVAVVGVIVAVWVFLKQKSVHESRKIHKAPKALDEDDTRATNVPQERNNEKAPPSAPPSSSWVIKNPKERINSP